MPRISDSDKLKAIEDITEIKSPEDLLFILKGIHTMWRKSSVPSEKLLNLVLKKKSASYSGYGLEFYDFILNYYKAGGTPEDKKDLEIMLSVGGRTDKYKGKDNNSKCRTAYVDEYNKSRNAEDCISEDSIVKKEDLILREIADVLYKDYHDGKIILLIKSWEQYIKRRNKKGLSIAIFFQKIAAKPKYLLVAFVLIFFFLSAMLLICISCISTVRSNNASMAYLYSVIENKKAKIKSISIRRDTIEITPGDRIDPEIEIAPEEAGKENLRSKSDNEDIATMTQNWEVIGGNGYEEGAENTARITLWGDDADLAEINVTLIPKYGTNENLDAPNGDNDGIGEIN